MTNAVGMLAVALFFGAGAALAQEKVLVQVPAGFEPAAPIAPESKSQCDVARNLGNRVVDALRPAFPGALPDAAAAGDAPALRMVIVGLDGVVPPGTRIPTGRYNMIVRAEIQVHGKLVATTTVNRTTSVGALPCGPSERIVAALAKDVARWAEAQLKLLPRAGS